MQCLYVADWKPQQDAALATHLKKSGKMKIPEWVDLMQDARHQLQSEQTKQTSGPTYVMLPVTDEKIIYPEFDSETNLVNRRNIAIYIIANRVTGKDYHNVNKVKDWAEKSIELLEKLPPISKRNSSPNKNRYPSGYDSSRIDRSVSNIYSRAYIGSCHFTNCVQG